ncbi:50S ribosomal protein L44e [Candidatus Woesearchaeota archaeon]|nr:50S ribosomal protein L44e [Candidatus Woesearchaeota archaeon]
MKLPKTRNKYCPFCRKHTQHKILQVKKGKPSALTYGSKYRAKLRGKARGMGSQGRYSKPAVTQWKQTGKKASKKSDLKYVCTECKKAHLQKKGKRAKKIEIV